MAFSFLAARFVEYMRCVTFSSIRFFTAFRMTSTGTLQAFPPLVILRLAEGSYAI